MDIGTIVEERTIIAGIRASGRIGLVLKQRYPDISERFRSGDSFKKISDDLELTEEFDVSEETARAAVRNSLGGYDGDKDTPPYNGSIPQEEYQRIAEDHIREGGARTGTIYGKKSFQQGTACFGVDSLTRQEGWDRKANNAGKISWVPRRGYPDFSLLAEDEVARSLSLNPSYLGRQGPNYQLIADQLNEWFHFGEVVRTKEAVRNKLRESNRYK